MTPCHRRCLARCTSTPPAAPSSPFSRRIAVIEFDYRAAFFWLCGCRSSSMPPTAGSRARAACPSGCPWFNGAKLDDIVDYLTYVFVPAPVVWRAASCPTRGRRLSAARMLLSSAYGFSRADAKTQDHFFTGFPSVLEHRRLLHAGAAAGPEAQRR